jgi:tripartite-type tricarboxylate transporter receptor subunit TctC
VPVSAGGSVDALARQISRHLGPLIVQAIAIENNGAGGGDVAFEAVARAAPDGHTLLTGWDSLAINPAVYPRVAFDPLVDFAPIIHLVSGAEVLAVKPELPGGAGVS